MERSNSFLTAIQQMDAGELPYILSEKLDELVAAVHAEEGSGVLTIKLKVAAIGSSGQVEVTSEIDSKLPKPMKGKTLFFSNEHGQLLRNDPRQKSLDLKFDGEAPRKASSDR